MTKYNYEFKLQIVRDYLDGKGGAKSLAKKYSVRTHGQIQNWINAYAMQGADGLRRSRSQKKYSFQFKLHAVELYLKSECSYRELATSLHMTNPTLLVRWVNDYKVAGPYALQPKKKGRRPRVSKPETTRPESKEAVYMKQLEEENLRLRIENAYLKELRRLRLQKETQSGKRGSSTASEDPSD